MTQERSTNCGELKEDGFQPQPFLKHSFVAVSVMLDLFLLNDR